MEIGGIKLRNNLILAPMAGFSCPALRRLCAESGAGLTVTEMISVKGLLYGNEKTFDLIKTSDAETVKCIQLFGREPQDFFEAAKLPQLEKFDIIDINMGCPVKKIAGAGEGSALIREPNRAAEIVSAVKAAGRIVTVKTRLTEGYSEFFGGLCGGVGGVGGVGKSGGDGEGGDLGGATDCICGADDEVRAEDRNGGIAACRESASGGAADPFEFVEALQRAGADMITIHARTPSQMYRGTADYAAFSLIKQRLSVPVGLSGDIVDETSFLRAQASGADFLMIGRGAVANPGIFADLLLREGKRNHSGGGLLEGGNGREEKKHLIMRLLEYMEEDMGEFTAVRAFRKFLPYVLKGEFCSREQKHSMNFIQDMAELKSALLGVFLERGK